MKKYLLIVESINFIISTEVAFIYENIKNERIGETMYYVWIDEKIRRKLMDEYNFMAIMRMDEMDEAWNIAFSFFRDINISYYDIKYY